MKKVRRAIHIDFHTMPGIYDICKNFSAEDFAQTLSDAHVDLVNVFAQCNIGFSYYPTKIGVPYPGLEGDMLGDTIKECHKRGIEVTAYLNTGLNHEATIRHPEWAKVNAEGQVIYGDKTANFFRTPCYNTGYREYVVSIVEEILTKDPDGIFCDCLIPFPCYCPTCTEKMLKEGVDINDPDAVYAFANRSMDEFCEAIRAVVPRDKRLFLNAPRYEEVEPMQSHVELECLTSSKAWGYDYFYPQALYLHHYRDEKIYMSGRFVKAWGDLGGIKTIASIENDGYDALMLGYAVSVGDHMHPADGLDKNMYRDIGKFYEKISKLDPWLDDAKLMTQIGVLRNKLGASQIDAGPSESNRGAVRMLSELHLNFDVVNEDMDISGYDMLILPDEINVTPKLSKKLADFKGAIISSGKSLDDSKTWNYLKYDGVDTHTNSFYKIGDDSVRAMYRPSVLIKAKKGESIPYIKAYFDRVWDGRHGYFYLPPDCETEHCAYVRNGNRVHICWDIFASYFNECAIFHKELVRDFIFSMLPKRLFVENSLPSTVRTTLMKKDDGVVLQVKSTYPELRGGSNVVEEHTVLSGGREVKVLGEYKSCIALPEKEELPSKIEDGYTTITLPEICGYKAFYLS